MTRTKHTFSRPRSSFQILLLLTFFFFAAVPVGSYRSEGKTGGEVPGIATAAVGRHPVPALSSSSLKFVTNEGQAPDSVRFVSHGSGYELFLLQQEAVLA